MAEDPWHALTADEHRCLEQVDTWQVAVNQLAGIVMAATVKRRGVVAMPVHHLYACPGATYISPGRF